jgi:hypothetical protein
MLAQAASGSTVTADVPIALRPEAGINRRDLAPAVLDELEKIVKKRPPGAQQLWLVLDFGIDSNVTAETGPAWREFLIHAARRPWLRVVVIGLRDTRQREFIAALPVDLAFVELLAELTLAEFETCAEGILKAIAPAKTLADVRTTIDTLWDQISERDASDGRLIVAVGAALQLRAALAKA